MFRLLITLLCLATPALAQTTPRADGGQTPYLEYIRTSAACPSLAILSPGFGGTERGLWQLADALADQGFRVIVIGHRESGPVQLRKALRANNRFAAIIKAAGDPAAHRARFLDLDAVWKIATAPCRPKFALLAGHSMGAQTTMIEAGALSLIGPMGQNRFDAYVALSPQGVGQRFGPGAWRAITKPVLMITGTRDSGVDGGYQTRLSAFDGLPPGKKRLAVIAGASHMNLGGRGGGPLVDLVPRIVLAFLGDLSAARTGSIRPISGVEFRKK